EKAGFYTPPMDNKKGGMNAIPSVSAPRVRWRLPTKTDWHQADIDGIRHVLPRMEDPRSSSGTCDAGGVHCAFWTTHTFANYPGIGVIFKGSDGEINGTQRSDNSNVFVRCIGAEIL